MHYVIIIWSLKEPAAESASTAVLISTIRGLSRSINANAILRSKFEDHIFQILESFIPEIHHNVNGIDNTYTSGRELSFGENVQLLTSCIVALNRSEVRYRATEIKCEFKFVKRFPILARLSIDSNIPVHLTSQILECILNCIKKISGAQISSDDSVLGIV